MSYLGSKLLVIQLQFKGKNSVSKSSIYTDILIANPSDPKIFPAFKVFDKLFCQELHPLEFFSSEKTPIFICGAKANFLALSYPIFDFRACLKFWDLTIANFPTNQLTFDVVLYPGPIVWVIPSFPSSQALKYNSIVSQLFTQASVSYTHLTLPTNREV